MPTQSPARAIINGRTFYLEVADDNASRSLGLSNRPGLPRDRAMLFVFSEERRWALWMKDMLFPLDVLFLDGGGRIVDIQTMQPQPGAPTSELRFYHASAPALYALEMNAGLAQEYGFQIGMTVEFVPPI